MKQIFAKMILFITSTLFMGSCGLSNESPGPFFWKVQKERKTSYFLGTFHVANTLEHLQCFRSNKETFRK